MGIKIQIPFNFRQILNDLLSVLVQIRVWACLLAITSGGLIIFKEILDLCLTPLHLLWHWPQNSWIGNYPSFCLFASSLWKVRTIDYWPVQSVGWCELTSNFWMYSILLFEDYRCEFWDLQCEVWDFLWLVVWPLFQWICYSIWLCLQL